MFERFTRLVRQSLVEANQESRTLGHTWLGTEHQLLGLLRVGDGIAFRVLVGAGVDYAATREAVVAEIGRGTDVDGEALAAIGIDLEEVRRQADASFGFGALERAMAGKDRGRGWVPFTRRAKRVLELSLAEALALEHGYIGTEHVLLGLLREGEGVGAQVLGQLAQAIDLRHYVMEQLRSAS